MKEYKTADIRNLAIIGAAQSGKTTLSDAFMFNAGAVSRQGSVDDGSSNMDFLPEEIERKNSIWSALLTLEHKNTKINFIDTPGYPSFISNPLAAANVCETALIIVDGDSGIDVGTKKAWRLANKEGLSRFIVVNKMDKERVDFDAILDSARNVLGKSIHPLAIPVMEGEKFKGLVNIITQKAYIGEGKSPQEQNIPANMKDRVEELRVALMESAAENSEELLNKYLEAGTLDDSDLMAGLKMGIISGEICLMMPASAKANTGVAKVIDALAEFAPDPETKKKPILCDDGSGKEIVRFCNGTDPSMLHLFKIMDDPKLGEYFFFKVAQGKAVPSLELTNVNTKQKERMGHLFTFVGKNREEVGIFHAGDIGATAKLKSVRIGHTLAEGKEETKIKLFDFPTPVHSEVVKTESEKDSEKMVEGLQWIHKMDPCFSNEHRPEFNEIVVSGMEKLHIDTMLEKVKKKMNISISLEKPRIPYRETIRGTAKAQGKYKKQTGGHGQYGDAHIEIFPQALGEGYLFEDNITGGVIPGKFIPAVDKGVQDAMKRGILAGYPLVDVRVSLFYGSYHNVDSSDMAFQMAGILAFKAAAEKANPILLEPIMNVKVTAPDDCVGDISADFNQRRGRILSMDPLGSGYTRLTANIPMSEMYNYSVDLKSMTKGDADFSESLEKYEAVPAAIAEKVIKEHQKAEA